MKNLRNILLFLTVMSVGLFAQTLTVNGNVSSSLGAVRNASITFTDNSNPSQKFSTVTDSAGNYQINVVVTAVNPEKNTQPSKFELEQNYPNPFSSSTSIPYKLKTQSDVHVTIYDILGRVVRQYTVGVQTPGTHNVLWDGRNNFGVKAATGIYFYRVQVDGQSLVRKMVFDAGAGNGFISLPGASSIQMSKINGRKNVNVAGSTFTVSVDNNENTLPALIPQQLTNVDIYGDTTVNVDVSIQKQVEVYPDSLQQIIRGFGAANILPWRADMTTAEVNTAFGNGPGQLGFTILRLRIPYNDNTSEFSANVPTAKLAESLGAIVFASPWTPSPSMKTNNSIIGGYLKTSSYADYAAHLKNFADYMSSQGVPLYAVSLQNEPDANVGYESCYWDATQFLNFCKNNAASIGTRIMMPESENFDHSLSDSTLNDSAAASNVSIIGGHLYGTSPAPYPLAKEKGKEVWMTEHYTDSQNSGNSWPLALQVGTEISGCMNAGMNAYVWWYIVRFYGPIGDGTVGTTQGVVTKRGYVMSQFSKFIRPGYHKIKSYLPPQKSPANGNIDVTAYTDSASSKIVIVAINNGSSTFYQTFSVENGSMKSVTPYTTSGTKNCEKGTDISVINGSFTGALGPNSITTFISN